MDMKIIILLTLSFTIFGILAVSCSKPTPLPVIYGRWSVINDTLSNTNDFYISAGSPVPGNYIGSPGDYYDFEPGGVLNLHENNQSYSTTYQLLPDNKISIPKVEFTMGTIEVFTAHNLSIYGTDTSSNGGVVVETLNLKR